MCCCILCVFVCIVVVGGSIGAIGIENYDNEVHSYVFCYCYYCVFFSRTYSKTTATQRKKKHTHRKRWNKLLWLLIALGIWNTFSWFINSVKSVRNFCCHYFKSGIASWGHRSLLNSLTCQLLWQSARPSHFYLAHPATFRSLQQQQQINAKLLETK